MWRELKNESVCTINHRDQKDLVEVKCGKVGLGVKMKVGDEPMRIRKMGIAVIRS